MWTKLSLLLALAFTVSLNAADKPKRELTEDQKAVQKEITDKYDTNKDGKLDRDERKGISKEDRKRLREAGLRGKKKEPKK